MIKCENGKCELNGTGGDIIVEMALIINSFKDAFDDNADGAMELAMAMSKNAALCLFAKEVKDMPNGIRSE